VVPNGLEKRDLGSVPKCFNPDRSIIGGFGAARGDIGERRLDRAHADIGCDFDLDMIEEVRSVWQFFRDRRPETYGKLVEL